MNYNNQLPIVYQYFTNITAIQNAAVLQQIWLSEIIGGMLLMCQNTTMQVYMHNGLKHVLFYVKKNM